MILLNRKRIYIILASLMISTVALQICYNYKKIEAVETVALPANNKTIIIDAGHGRRGSEEL